MTDLQTILQAIDELPAEALQQVRQQLERREGILSPTPKQRTPKEIEKLIAELDVVVAEFRAGLTPEEWDEAAKAMNEEYIEPEDSSLFGWGDEVPESKT